MTTLTGHFDQAGLVFNQDDIATVLINGTTYGGEWVLNAWALVHGKPSELPIGSANLGGRGLSAADAFSAGADWLTTVLTSSGLQVAAVQDRSTDIPADQRPYFTGGIVIVDRRKEQAER